MKNQLQQAAKTYKYFTKLALIGFLLIVTGAIIAFVGTQIPGTVGSLVVITGIAVAIIGGFLAGGNIFM